MVKLNPGLEADRANAGLKWTSSRLALGVGLVAGALASVAIPAPALALEVDAEETSAIHVPADDTLTVTANGSINVADNDGVKVDGDNVLITNNGLIRSDDDEAIEANERDGLTIINNGTIIADVNGDKGIEGNAGLTITNNVGGVIKSVTSEAIEADAAGLTLTNHGQILSYVDDGVDGDEDVTLVNTGLIQGGQNDAMELNNGTVDNSGTIISLSSDPAGSLVLGGDVPELDAGIDFDAGADGKEDGIIWNRAGGLIEGDIGIVSSPGNQDAPDTNDGRQEIYNWGTITGRMGDAALLGNGDDLFVQYDTGIVNGSVDLQAGNDHFVHTGLASSITGHAIGGEGTDTARFTGTYDKDLFLGFEAATFADVRFDGARAIAADVEIEGNATFDLGLDRLAVDGDLALADGSLITILTTGGFDLIGTGPVDVLTETGAFTDNGTTVAIVEDDWLLDYAVGLGSLHVTVTAADPSAGTADGNIAALGGAIQSGVTAGSLDTDVRNAFNAIGSLAAFETAAAASLPGLDGSIGREIFESSNLASDMLGRRLRSGETGSVWGQFGIRTADSDRVSLTVSGYEADETVFTLGADYALGDSTVLGVVGSYADIESTATGPAVSGNQIEAFKISAYGAASFGDTGFFNGELGYHFANVDTLRNGVLGPVSAAFDASGIIARGTLGYGFAAGEGLTITPSAGLNYAAINFDSYAETGGFGFNVDREKVTFLEGRLGLGVEAETGPVRPYASATYVHDFASDPRLVMLSSNQIASFAVTSDQPDEDRVDAAAGIEIGLGASAKLTAGYRGTFAGDYTSHAGLLAIGLDF